MAIARDGVVNAAECRNQLTDEDDKEMVVVLAPAPAFATLSTLALLDFYLHMKGSVSKDRKGDAFDAPSNMSVTSNDYFLTANNNVSACS